MDIIPSKRADQYLWWKNLSDNLTVEGPKMGLAAADVTAAKAVADDQVAKMDATEAARAALDGARAAEATSTVSNQANMRALGPKGECPWSARPSRFLREAWKPERP